MFKVMKTDPRCIVFVKLFKTTFILNHGFGIHVLRFLMNMLTFDPILDYNFKIKQDTTFVFKNEVYISTNTFKRSLAPPFQK